MGHAANSHRQSSNDTRQISNGNYNISRRGAWSQYHILRPKRMEVLCARTMDPCLQSCPLRRWGLPGASTPHQGGGTTSHSTRRSPFGSDANKRKISAYTHDFRKYFTTSKVTMKSKLLQ